MNVLDKKFVENKKENKGVLITYFPIGEVGFDAVEMAQMYHENGTDVLEIGFPIPDPHLDGKVVSDSMARILAAGFTKEDFFSEIRRIHESVPDIVLEVFTYAKLFDQLTVEDFVNRCEDAGVDAVLVADASKELRKELDEEVSDNLINLRFLRNDFSDEDLNDLRKNGKGYVLLQAAPGTTGARKELKTDLEEKLKTVKETFPHLNICPGFGISNEEHCSQIMSWGADGVIIGSLVANSVWKNGLEETGKLIKRLKASLVRPNR